MSRDEQIQHLTEWQHETGTYVLCWACATGEGTLKGILEPIGFYTKPAICDDCNWAMNEAEVDRLSTTYQYAPYREFPGYE